MFRSILEYQKSQLLLWSFLRSSQFLPCQNSPSQNIAIFIFLITKSGFPKTVLSFLRYLTPAFHNNLPNKSSSWVPFPLFADIFLCRCSFVRRSIIFLVLKAVHTTSVMQKYLFILKLRVCFAGKHKKALLFYRETFNYPDFGGRSSRNVARFSGVTRNVLSYSKHTLPCSCEHQV